MLVDCCVYRWRTRVRCIAWCTMVVCHMIWGKRSVKLNTPFHGQTVSIFCLCNATADQRQDCLSNKTSPLVIPRSGTHRRPSEGTGPSPLSGWGLTVLICGALWNSGLDLAVAHWMTGEQTAGVGGTPALFRGCPLGFAGRFNPGYAWAAGRLLGKSCWALWYCSLLSWCVQVWP